MSDLHHRLHTLLFLVPYVVRHQGVSLNRLAELLGMSERQLMNEIDFLIMVGRPPFQPNDFLDIYYESGKVYADLHQSLERPPRLTVFEALALACAARMFSDYDQAAEEPSLVRSAVGKVVASLPGDAKKLFEQLSSRYWIHSGSDAHLAVLRKAAQDRQELEIDYYTARRAELTKRRVQPIGIVWRNGVWYLVAYCTHRRAHRLFRVSRIQKCKLQQRRFDAWGDFDLETFVDHNLTIPLCGQREVRVRFAAQLSPWIRERWAPEYYQAEPDGAVVVKMHDVSDEWVLAYVSSFGGEAKIITPKELRTKLGQQALAALAKYETPS